MPKFTVYEHPAIQGELSAGCDVVENMPGGGTRTLASFSKYLTQAGLPAKREAETLCTKLNSRR